MKTTMTATPKVGDRVIFVGQFCDNLKGRSGIVIRVNKNGVCWVKFDHKPGHRGYPILPDSLRSVE